MPLATADPTAQADNPTLVRTSAIEPTPAADLSSADPAAPPPLGPPPSGARYPLFADTVQPPASAPRPAPAQPAPYAAPPARRRSLLPWLIGLLALAVIAVVAGGLLVLAPSGSEEADDPKPAAQEDGRHDNDGDGDDDDGAHPGAVLAPADVSVPGTAPASVDEHGNPVTFEAQNMLDADPRTSWRMAGDGSGAVITFRYDDPVTVTQVGLINGYAKTDPPHDWYAGNRRIELVEWVFDDGTVVTQELGDDPSLQTVPVDAEETTSVELRILEVTEPGGGPDGRDFTAISGVEIAGSAA